jgi:predicted  nucleic acid-binding Zn-ribbon protein
VPGIFPAISALKKLLGAFCYRQSDTTPLFSFVLECFMLKGMKTLLVLLLLSVTACSHAPDRTKENDAEVATLSKPAADQRLAEVRKSLETMEERVRAAHARLVNAEAQATTDVTKQSAVDGAEAELASLQQKRAALSHEEHTLEARLRELDN